MGRTANSRLCRSRVDYVRADEELEVTATEDNEVEDVDEDNYNKIVYWSTIEESEEVHSAAR